MALDSLNMSVFSLNGSNLLAVLKTFALPVDNDVSDGSGLADRYEREVVTKQSQKVDFTVFQNNSNGVPCSNLDVSVWTLGGNYLGTLRGGSINLTTVTRERSSIATGYKVPNANRTQYEVTTDLLVIDNAFTNAMITASGQAEFVVAVAITFGVTTFSANMTMRSTRITVDRGEMQMENVTFGPYGTPSGPNDSSLMGTILLGSAAYTGIFDNGGSTYTGQVLITRLNTRFADSSLIESEGTLEVQGSFSVSGA